MKMSSFYICVSKITIIWCMLPEIWVQSHNFLSFWVIFCPFTPLLAPKIKNWKKIRRYFLFHMCTINKDSWDIRHNRQKFCPFVPLINQKIKILKKWKKAPRDIIILHLSTTNDNHVMYSSWDMVFNRQNLFSFWTIFYPFTEKSKFWKKKAWRYHQLTLVYHKLQSYDVWFLRYKVQGTEFSVDYFLPFWPPPPKNLENQNIDKMKKKKQFLEILSFVPLLHKWKSYDVWVLIYGVW